MQRLIALLAIVMLAQNGDNAVGVQRKLTDVAQDLKNLADSLLEEVRAIADRDGPEDDSSTTS